MSKHCLLCSLEAGQEVRHAEEQFHLSGKGDGVRDRSCRRWRAVPKHTKDALRMAAGYGRRGQALKKRKPPPPAGLWRLALYSRWSAQVV